MNKRLILENINKGKIEDSKVDLRLFKMEFLIKLIK